MKQDFGTTSKSTNYEAHLTNTATSKATRDQGNADTFATSNLKYDVDYPKVKHRTLEFLCLSILFLILTNFIFAYVLSSIIYNI